MSATAPIAIIAIMSSAKAIPIIVAGAHEAMGAKVASALAPEVEMIYFVPRDVRTQEVPILFRGEKPDSPSSSVGTGNFGVAPKAILLGGAFKAADIEELRTLAATGAAATGKEKLRIPWISIDNSKSEIPLGPGYAEDVAARCKSVILRLKEEGKLEGNDEGIYRV